MPVQLRRCESDEDYARFTLHFIRNRTEFSSRFLLMDALEYVMHSFQQSHTLLLEGEDGKLCGWVQYRYIEEEEENAPPGSRGDIAFVESVAINPEHRRSRAFFKGFRDLVGRIACENGRVKAVHFHALADNAYLNRLYAKFARPIGEREGYGGTENVYAADINRLLRYLRLAKE